MRAKTTFSMLVLMAVQVLATPARADEEADKAAAARRVLAIAFSPESYQKLSDVMSSQLPAELRGDMAKILPTYQEMADLQLGLFVKYFTAAELKEVAKFYASPTGRKAIKVMPEIAADAQGVLMSRLQTEMPKLIAKMKQQQGDSAAPAPTP